MFKTTIHNLNDIDYITVSTEKLAELLDCGKITAKKIGTEAGAKIQIGRRTLWNMSKIKKYIDTL